MIIQLQLAIVMVLLIVAIASGIITGICFFVYNKKNKQSETLYKLGIGCFVLFLLCCLGIWSISTAEDRYKAFLESL